MAKQQVWAMRKISIIVPVYKVDKYLNRCVESIVNQTYKDLEIILIDDGSPDSCPVLCDEWAKRDNRIKVIHKQNAGVSAARNAGIEIATGDYIGFVDSDDYIQPQMFEKLLKNITDNKSQLAVCGLFKDELQIKADNCQCAASDAALAMLFNIIDYPYFEGYVWNKLYDSEIIKVNNLRFDISLKMSEDTLFNFKYLQYADKVSILNSSEYHYVYRAMSVMNNKNLDNDFKMIALIDYFIDHANSQEIKDCVVRWAYKYWVKAVDGYVVYKEGCEYQKHVISLLKKYKAFVLRDKYFSKVEKLFSILICNFKFVYIIYKRLKYAG